jgi:acyl carrier protein
MEKLAKKQVIDIVAMQFENPVQITEESSMDTIAEWDSLVHLGIIVALDVELDGQAASIKKLAACRSVADIISCLKEHQLYTD